MTWVWFSVLALLAGAELNAEIEHRTAVDSTIGEDRPMGQRGAAMADTVGKPFILHESLSLLHESLSHGAGMARRQARALLRPLRDGVSRSYPRASRAARPGPRRSGDR